LHRHAEAHAVSIAAHIGRHVQALGLERGVE
jgi:hypothetical protein